jgi:hypothetical protein
MTTVRDFSRDELQIARASREDELIRQWLDPDPTSLAAMAEGDGPPSFPTAELSELRAAVQDSATHEQEAFGLGLTIPV